MNRDQEAIDKAKEIYLQYSTGLEAVDLNKIADGENIILEQVDESFLREIVTVFKKNQSFYNISGLFISKNILNNQKYKGNAIILVNKDDAPSRKRFTIAHELGHYFLSYQDGENIVSVKLRSENYPYSKESDSERCANKFAAEILMPAERIKAYIESDSNDILKSSSERLIDLANKFGVSHIAMGHRLKNLGLYL